MRANQHRELAKLRRVQIGDCPEGRSAFPPVQDMETLHITRFQLALGAIRREYPQIHHVLTAPVNDRRCRVAPDHIEASADQRETVRRKVRNGGSKTQLPLEPRLHRMLIGARHIDQVIGQHRLQMVDPPFAARSNRPIAPY